MLLKERVGKAPDRGEQAEALPLQKETLPTQMYMLTIEVNKWLKYIKK